MLNAFDFTGERELVFNAHGKGRVDVVKPGPAILWGILESTHQEGVVSNEEDMEGISKSQTIAKGFATTAAPAVTPGSAHSNEGHAAFFQGLPVVEVTQPVSPSAQMPEAAPLVKEMECRGDGESMANEPKNTQTLSTAASPPEPDPCENDKEYGGGSAAAIAQKPLPPASTPLNGALAPCYLRTAEPILSNKCGEQGPLVRNRNKNTIFKSAKSSLSWLMLDDEDDGTVSLNTSPFKATSLPPPSSTPSATISRPESIIQYNSASDKFPPEVSPLQPRQGGESALAKENVHPCPSIDATGIYPTPPESPVLMRSKKATVGQSQRPQLPQKSVEPPSLYTVKASPGKGLGMFATRQISKGTCILAEKPFFLIKRPYKTSDIDTQFRAMPYEKRCQYTQLYCPKNPATETNIVRIFEANRFEISSASAIFLKGTRFNHSCTRNVHFNWNDDRHQMTFYAVTDIAEGEELTVTYGFPIQTRAERHAAMQHYGFTCTCPACHPDTYLESDRRRLAIAELDNLVFECESANENQAIQAARQMTELLKEEGLHSEMIPQYNFLMETYGWRGEHELALEFGWKTLEMEVRCLGEDNEAVKETKGYLDRIRAVIEDERGEKRG